MFSHVMLGGNDIDRSKKFYDALLGSIGSAPGDIDELGRLRYVHNNGVFVLTKPVDG